MRPVVQAILVADAVYQDVTTKKWIVAGTFDHMLVVKKQPPKAEAAEERQPLKPEAAEERKPPKAESAEERRPPQPVHEVRRAGSPYVYINVREIHGQANLELRLVHLGTNEICFRTNPFAVKCDDPLRSVELSISLPPLPQAPGAYALELLCEDEIIGSHRIVVIGISES